jgi:hypothetical protein
MSAFDPKRTLLVRLETRGAGDGTAGAIKLLRSRVMQWHACDRSYLGAPVLVVGRPAWREFCAKKLRDADHRYPRKDTAANHRHDFRRHWVT